MAVTNLPTNSADKIRAYRRSLALISKRKSFFYERFIGTGDDSIIKEVEDLRANNKGDKVFFDYVDRIDARDKPGVTGTTALVGAETKLFSYQDSVELEFYRQGITMNDPRDWTKRTAWDVPSAIKEALTDWKAERMDNVIYDALTTSPTVTLYKEDSAGAYTAENSFATAAADLSATNSVVDLDFLRWLGTWAITGGGRQSFAIRPVKVNQESVYVLLVSNAVAYEMQKLSDWENANLYAQARSESNRLFKYADSMWSFPGGQLVVMPWEGVVEAATGGTGGNVRYSKCLLLGASSGVLAKGADPKIIIDDSETRANDYGFQIGFVMQCLFGVKKVQYNSKDYGCISVPIAHSNVNVTIS